MWTEKSTQICQLLSVSLVHPFGNEPVGRSGSLAETMLCCPDFHLGQGFCHELTVSGSGTEPQ